MNPDEESGGGWAAQTLAAVAVALSCVAILLELLKVRFPWQ